MKFKNICKDKLDIVILGCLVAVFGYFFLCNDIVECGDSFQYIHQYPMREPVYSLFLELYQVVFKDYYMKAVGFTQNLLAIICTYWTYRRIRTIMDFKILFSIGTFVVLIAPHLFTPIASVTKLILTNSIMTEGITISLYNIWFAMLVGVIWKYYDDKSKNKVMVITFVIGLVLSMTRGQMILCLPVWFLVFAFEKLRNDGTVKKKIVSLVIYVAVIAVSLMAKTQFTKWYNLAETGYYVNTISSKPMMLANILYVCDESDADYIQDEGIREAFKGVIKDANNRELSIDYAPEGIIGKGLFHESGHEILNFEVIDPAIRVIIKDRTGVDEEQFLYLMILEDEMCNGIIKQLLPNVIGKYFRNYINIATLGFVRSVAVEKSVFPIYALFIYLVAIALTVYGLTQKSLRNNAYTTVLVLVLICGNVLGTSLMIQCITRYMIYNLPFFYIAGMGFISTIWREKNNK